MKFRVFLLVICVSLPNILNAQTAQKAKEDLSIAVNGEALLYGSDSIAFGGGIMMGYGTGSMLGTKLAYYLNTEEDLAILELSFIFRFYLLGAGMYKGPFVQLMTGPSLINRSGSLEIPPNTGAISVGLCLGWRFLFNDRWFIEPAIRGGYPYIAGAGLSAGVRF